MEHPGLPSNPNQNRGRLEPVVNAKDRKENKFLEIGKRLCEYALNDVLKPAFKKTLFDIIDGSARMTLMDGQQPKSGYNTYNNNRSIQSVNSYDSIWSKTNQTSISSGSSYANGYYVYGIPDRNSVDKLVAAICQTIDRYGDITASQVYELTHERTAPPPPYTDNNYGWSTINGYSFHWNGDGFVLILPPPQPIRR